MPFTRIHLNPTYSKTGVSNMGTKTMKITVEGEGFGGSSREWQVEEELIRPYCIAYDAWIAKGGVELSKGIYDAMKDAGIDTIETLAAPVMVRVAE
jgi:hypothetical protein